MLVVMLAVMEGTGQDKSAKFVWYCHVLNFDTNFKVKVKA